MAVHFSFPAFILGPDGCTSRAGHVTTHNYFNRKHGQFFDDHHIRVRIGNNVVGDDVLRSIEPETSNSVQNRALIRNRSDRAVKGAQAVRGHENHASVPQIKGIADFALVMVRQKGGDFGEGFCCHLLLLKGNSCFGEGKGMF